MAMYGIDVTQHKELPISAKQDIKTLQELCFRKKVLLVNVKTDDLSN